MKVYIKYNSKKYPAPETEKELNRTARLWRRNAQAKLRRENANASGVLKSSMKTRLGMNGDQPFADITPNVSYWEFIDKGVQGAQLNPFRRQNESPFKYKSKKPPLDMILKWMTVKPIRGRGKDGKFIKKESAAYLIQRSIWSRGIRPLFFISDTGKRIEKKYADSIAQAYALDLENALENSLKG